MYSCIYFNICIAHLCRETHNDFPRDFPFVCYYYYFFNYDHYFFGGQIDDNLIGCDMAPHAFIYLTFIFFVFENNVEPWNNPFSPPTKQQ